MLEQHFRNELPGRQDSPVNYADSIGVGGYRIDIHKPAKSAATRLHPVEWNAGEAAVTIDCSGDGDVAARGNVAWAKGRTGDGLVQAPTLVFKLAGVNRLGFISGCRNPEINYRAWIAPYPELRAKMMRRIDRMNVTICGGYAKLHRAGSTSWRIRSAAISYRGRETTSAR